MLNKGDSAYNWEDKDNDKQLIGLDMFQKDGVSVNGYVIAKSGSRHEPINLSDEQIKSIFDRASGIKMNCILATSSTEDLENISDDVAKTIMSNTCTKVFLSVNKEDNVEQEVFKNAAWKLDLDGEVK